MGPTTWAGTRKPPGTASTAFPAGSSPGEYRVRGLVYPGIDLRYEFSVYNGGSPAWPTADTRAAGSPTTRRPAAACTCPAIGSPGGKPLVFLGSYVSEGGDGLAWVDLEGRKQGGVGWVGGAWTGAPYLARDAGVAARLTLRPAWPPGLMLRPAWPPGLTPRLTPSPTPVPPGKASCG